MTKPHGRKTKKKVSRILKLYHRPTAVAELEQIPDDWLTGPLFGHLYHKEDLIRFRAAAAMGLLATRLSARRMEKARIVLRRIMWNLNDESGGIGWGSPEAMGEILSLNPELADEFKSILFSYLDPGGNYIEHEMLQRGVLWGIGTYLDADPDALTCKTADQLHGHLESDDPVKRGYALRAMKNATALPDRIPEEIRQDTSTVMIFDGWDLVSHRIKDITMS